MTARGIRVSLSSGETFYVDAEIGEVAAVLSKRALVRVGSRFVNATQVAQITVDNVPSIETAERLDD